jgi:hypothetical protein
MESIQIFDTVMPLSVPDHDVFDNSSAFFQTRMLIYMDRLLDANLDLNKEALEFIFFILNPELATNYYKSIKNLLPPKKNPKGPARTFLSRTQPHFPTLARKSLICFPEKPEIRRESLSDKH